VTMTRKGMFALLLGATLASELFWATPARSESIEQLAARAETLCQREKQNLESFVQAMDQFALYKFLVRLYQIMSNAKPAQGSAVPRPAGPQNGREPTLKPSRLPPRPSAPRSPTNDPVLERMRRIESGE